MNYSRESFEFFEKSVSRRKPILAFPGKESHDNSVQSGILTRQIGTKRGQRLRGALQVLVHPALGVHGVERGASGEHLIEHSAECVKIGAAVEFVSRCAAPLFGSGVLGREQQAVGTAQVGDVFGHGGDAEVEHLDLDFAAARFNPQEEVFGLDIAVNGAAGVGGRQSGPNSADDLQRPGNRDRALGLAKNSPDACPWDVFHSDEQAPVLVLVEIDDLHQVRVAQLVGGASLVTESLHELRVLTEFHSQKLEGQLAAQKQVLGEINSAHAPLSKFADYAILSAHQMARDEFAGFDEHRAVGGASSVFDGIWGVADRTGLHLIFGTSIEGMRGKPRPKKHNTFECARGE